MMTFIHIHSYHAHSARLLACLLGPFTNTSYEFSDVCTKYQEASKIVNLALTGLISQCIAGAKIIDLCQVSTHYCTVPTTVLYPLPTV